VESLLLSFLRETKDGYGHQSSGIPFKALSSPRGLISDLMNGGGLLEKRA